MPRTTYTLPADLEALLTTENYPGMIPSESRPLRAFIRRHGAHFDELRFMVRLGDGLDAGAGADPAMARMLATWNTKRPDVIAWKAPHDATIVEVKQQLDNAGVWQILAYRDEYARAQPTHALRLILVAEAATPSARILAQQHGIALYLYEFPPDTVDVTAPATEVSSDGI